MATLFMAALVATTSATAVRTPLIALRADSAMSKALVLRGGAADIGPINAYNVGMASAICGAMYFAQMFFMTEKAGEMYWGEKNEPKSVQAKTMTKWFGLAILQQAAVSFWALHNGFDPVLLAKVGAFNWGIALMKYYQDFAVEKLIQDPSGMVVQGAFFALSVYFGFF